MRLVLLLSPLLLLACATGRTPAEEAIPAVEAWRSLATAEDRERVREWRTAWVRALEQARAAGHGAEIAREGALLEPDAALTEAVPLPGDYRCRTIKVGGKSEGLLDYVAYPYFNCRIEAAAEGEGVLSFTKLTGSQRAIGRLFLESQRRMVFLGTLQLGDERGVLKYGHDEERDMAGVLERVGERQWRLVFPYPAFESTLDVLELIPQG